MFLLYSDPKNCSGHIFLSLLLDNVLEIHGLALVFHTTRIAQICRVSTCSHMIATQYGLRHRRAHLVCGRLLQLLRAKIVTSLLTSLTSCCIMWDTIKHVNELWEKFAISASPTLAIEILTLFKDIVLWYKLRLWGSVSSAHRVFCHSAPVTLYNWLSDARITRLSRSWCFFCMSPLVASIYLLSLLIYAVLWVNKILLGYQSRLAVWS